MGRHNANWDATQSRLIKGATYKDCATICVIPTRGLIPARVVQSWMNLMAPMNQKFTRMIFEGLEVGQAYQQAFEAIVANPELAKWPYVLTLEEDNLPPPDGLIKLIEAIEGGVDGKKYDAVGGLYWTKGEEGQPMIYGDPADLPLNFRPQPPRVETVHPCNGLGMGFTLFRLRMFLEGKIPRPWFKTEQSWHPNVGVQIYTQDLYFFERAGKAGYRFAADTRVRVGHLDVQTGMVW